MTTQVDGEEYQNPELREGEVPSIDLYSKQQHHHHLIPNPEHRPPFRYITTTVTFLQHTADPTGVVSSLYRLSVSKFGNWF